jgi:hypothetical protein
LRPHQELAKHGSGLYKAGPISFSGISKVIECVPDRSIIIRNESDFLDTTWNWVCEEHKPNSTALSVRIVFSSNQNHLFAKSLRESFHRELVISLRKLKSILEKP